MRGSVAAVGPRGAPGRPFPGPTLTPEDPLKILTEADAAGIWWSVAILTVILGFLIGLFGEPAAAPAEPVAVDDVMGTVMVLNKAAATVSMLDRVSGELLGEVEVGHGPHEVALSPDGETAVVSNYGDMKPGQTLSVIDVPTAKVVRTIDLGEYRRPHGVQFLPCGQKVAVTTELNQCMVVVDIKAGAVTGAIKTGAKGSHMVALSPDGARAYVSNVGSGSLCVLDVAKQETLATIPTGEGAEGLDVHPTGSEVWVANNKAGTISIVDALKLEVTQTLECAGYPIRVKMTPDGAFAMLSCAQSGEVAVFDVPGRKEVRRIDVRSEVELPRQGAFGDSPVPIGIAIDTRSEGSGRAFVSLGRTGEVVVIETGSWTVKGRWKAGNGPDGIGWTRARVAGAAKPN
jgi:YVTN family beta-propeller protein